MAAGDALTASQSKRVEEAVAAAISQSGLHFSVFVGDVVEVLPDAPRSESDDDAPVAGDGRPKAQEQAPRGGTGGLRETAERLHGALGDRSDEAVLVLVAPGQRRLEIVTGPEARRRLPDRACSLAALSMTTAFSGGDLVGGLANGLRMLADTASRH